MERKPRVLTKYLSPHVNSKPAPASSSIAPIYGKVNVYARTSRDQQAEVYTRGSPGLSDGRLTDDVVHDESVEVLIFLDHERSDLGRHLWRMSWLGRVEQRKMMVSWSEGDAIRHLVLPVSISPKKGSWAVNALKYSRQL